MQNSNKDEIVCLTGSTGFIGSHIALLLLEQGYKVRMPIRKLSIDKKEGLIRKFSGYEEQADIFEFDLLDGQSVRDAIAEASYVIHTASNYVLDAANPLVDLVEVAQLGTHNILQGCKNSPSVKRAVFTSSIAAVTDSPPERILTEKDWNSLSTIRRNPYYYAKTVAEKSIWDFHKHAHHFDSVVINPSLTIGPAYTPELNTSNKVIKDMMSGIFPGILDLSWNIVDVRDVAQAHIFAMKIPIAKGRYLCTNETWAMRDVVSFIKEYGFGQYELPRVKMHGPILNRVVKILAHFEQPGARDYLRTHIGKFPRYNNLKITGQLGMAFRPAKETLMDTVCDLINWGHLQNKT